MPEFEQTQEFVAAVESYATEKFLTAIDCLYASMAEYVKALRGLKVNPEDENLQAQVQEAKSKSDQASREYETAREQLYHKHRWRFLSGTFFVTYGKCDGCGLKIQFSRPFRGEVTEPPESVARGL